MTALVHRSLIGLARCPRCERPVYLGDCEPEEDLHGFYTWRSTRPARHHYARWWECTHQGPAGTVHQWATIDLEIRPVTALHVVQVVTAPAPTGHTTSTAPPADDATAATATATTAPPRDAPAATDTPAPAPDRYPTREG